VAGSVLPGPGPAPLVGIDVDVVGLELESRRLLYMQQKNNNPRMMAAMTIAATAIPALNPVV